MEANTTLICRLCLKICDKNFELIEEATHGILNFLLLSLDLAISSESVVCKTCTGNLKKCFDFKADCLRMENDIDFCIKEDDRKIHELEVNQKEDLITNSDDDKTCYFCAKYLKQDSKVPLENENVDLKMLEKYFPELDLNVVRESVICEYCYDSLQSHFAFITNCLSVEEKINQYCKVEGTNGKNQVELSSVLHFTKKNELQNSNGHSSLHAVKIEEESLDGLKSVNDKVEVKNENLIEVDEKDLDVKNVNETDQNDHDSFQDTYELYLQQLERKANLLKHKSTSEVPMYKCEMCTYQTKYKSHVKKHILTHKSTSEAAIFKCKLCGHQVKHKISLQLHMLTHKNSSELTMYKCKECDFQTKYKNNLSSHMLTHKSTSEVMMYKCDMCVYQTKYKGALQNHMIKHKRFSNKAMYKCEMCLYKSKRKENPQTHMLVHKSASEIKMFKCYTCLYETKRKASFLQHMVTHRSISEVTMYKCTDCAFQTKHKTSLSRHVLSHKSTIEITMYKCGECEYKSRYKATLNTHMLTHKISEGVAVYKCEVCTYQSKRKDSLQRHMGIHKNRNV